MIPGIDHVYKCPNCGSLIARKSIVSGNTFGAKVYSDGKRIAPMLPDFPNLTKCVKCNTFLWLSKLKDLIRMEHRSSLLKKLDKLGKRLGFSRSKNQDYGYWNNEVYAEFLSIEDGFKAISLNFARDDQERKHIREHIWQSYNDRKRDGIAMFDDENDRKRWENNCKELLSLLDLAASTEKIMIAEIHRNLGRFEDCKTIIQSLDSEFDWLKEKLIAECNDSNPWVVQLN